MLSAQWWCILPVQPGLGAHSVLVWCGGRNVSVWQRGPGQCSSFDKGENDLPFNATVDLLALCSFPIFLKTSQNIPPLSLLFLTESFLQNQPALSLPSAFTASFILLPSRQSHSSLSYALGDHRFGDQFVILCYSPILYHHFFPSSHFITNLQELQYILNIVRQGDLGLMFLIIFSLLTLAPFYNFLE